jgi:hypothetical protein
MEIRLSITPDINNLALQSAIETIDYQIQNFTILGQKAYLIHLATILVSDYCSFMNILAQPIAPLDIKLGYQEIVFFNQGTVFCKPVSQDCEDVLVYSRPNDKLLKTWLLVVRIQADLKKAEVLGSLPINWSGYKRVCLSDLKNPLELFEAIYLKQNPKKDLEVDL